MLWLALHLPHLPLEISTRGHPAPTPLVIASSAKASAEIFACNGPALEHGIEPGTTAAAAWALASELRVLARDESAERAAIERVAAWAMQFTPAVSIAGPSGVLLEVAGSLKLVGGLNALWNRIEHGIRAMGYTACLAVAPTPLAAQWFARAGLSPRIRHADALRLSLAQLPASVLELPGQSEDFLQAIGVSTLGDCMKLPRDGLARRLGQHALDLMDRALGSLPDPRKNFLPPRNFQARLPLPTAVESADTLLFAARRLVTELCGLLAATGAGVQRLKFSLSHDNGNDSCFHIDLVAASRDSDHLLRVLRERLERVALRLPVVALSLESEQLQPLARGSHSFLPDERANAEGFSRLLERLRARLGDAAVQGYKTVADFRPECAWDTCTPGNAGSAYISEPTGARPLWLLDPPRVLAARSERPQYEGALSLMTRPENLASGWWDSNDIRRDYFVARNPANSLLWVYRDSSSWRLHGFFS